MFSDVLKDLNWNEISDKIKQKTDLNNFFISLTPFISIYMRVSVDYHRVFCYNEKNSFQKVSL